MLSNASGVSLQYVDASACVTFINLRVNQRKPSEQPKASLIYQLLMSQRTEHWQSHLESGVVVWRA
jgi:hypothetical protein